MNSLYQIIYTQRRVILSPNAAIWKQRVKQLVPAFHIPPSSYLCLGPIDFYAKWLTQAKQPRRFDVHNCVKLLADALCERWGVDDCWVWEAGPYRKVEATERVGIEVTVATMPGVTHVRSVQAGAQ